WCTVFHWRGIHSAASRSLLGRDGSLLGELDDIFGMDADGSPRRTGPDTGRAAFEGCAAIAFDRRLGSLFGRPAADPTQQTGLRGHFGELNHTIRTVFDTVATANAGISNGHLAVGQPMDGIGRAVLHAMRMLTVPAGRGQMQREQRWTGASI